MAAQLRNGLRRCAGVAVSVLPFGLTRRLSASAILFPYYHIVADESVPHFEYCGGCPTPARFTSDLEFLLKHFKPLDLRELIASLKEQRELPGRRFLLSFDDGYREMYEIVRPILLAKGVPAAFFVNSVSIDNKTLVFYNALSLAMSRLGLAKVNRHLAFARRGELEAQCRREGIDLTGYLESRKPYLTSDQIATMIGEGFTFGGHGVDHTPLAELPFEVQMAQVRGSLQFLRPLGVKYSAFAFPGGDRGITSRLFRALSAEVDVSFGTAGGTPDPVRTHFQRTCLEADGSTAQKLVSERLALESYRRLWGTNLVRRE